MRRLIMATAVAVLVLSGCGDDDGEEAGASPEEIAEEVEDLDELSADELETLEEDAEESLPSCDELYAEGNVLTAAENDAGCVDAEGEWIIYPTQFFDCEDGRTLEWNELGWWYDGEGVQAFEPGESEPPAAETSAC